MEKDLLAQMKVALREIIANNGWVPDQESFNLFYQIVVGSAIEVCAVNERGELLLQHRAFTEWPGEWGKVVSWYIPGGLVRVNDLSLEEECQANLKKDGVLNQVQFIETCYTHPWKKGEHPFGWLFVSNLCVCRIVGKLDVKSGMESKFKFVNEVVPSGVPHHTKFQEEFFKWRDKNAHMFNR